ncbi:MAG TPA: c-type cytochrome [Gammaproteobacteria bacterium]|nr:c-type cytochrome [Gammaproteobacteria bacterium]
MQGISILGRSLVLVAGLLLGAGLGLGSAPANAAKFSGPLAKTIAKGKHIFTHDSFGGRGMTCASCHTAAGTGPTVVPGQNMKGPTLNNAAAIFPKYKQRNGKVITLADQIHGCIAGAMGGQPPAYSSDKMRALVTYLTSLSEGKTIEMGGKLK